MSKTNIAWTEQTWNPVTGCTKISPGCKNCYAADLANRFWVDRKFGDVRCHPDRLEQPLRRRKRTMYFVNSMSDLFHEDVPDSFIDEIFAVMALCPQHTFQVLTKRPERMRDYFKPISIGDGGPSLPRGFRVVDIADLRIPPPNKVPSCWPLPNVWLGVSVENQHYADLRIPPLLETPAALRFVSCEQLLGYLNLHRVNYHNSYGTALVDALEGKKYSLSPSSRNAMPFRPSNKLDWVIIGGESGPNYRPCEVAWIASLVEQCRAAGVAAFVKQDCGPRPGQQGRIPDELWSVKEYPKTGE